MVIEFWPSKDPNSIEPYFIVWCDPTGLNDGSASDEGELQGAEILTCTWIVPDGLTKNSDNLNAITINGVAYAANTVATIWVSGGELGVTYTVVCRVTTSDSRTLDKSAKLRIVQE